MPSSFFLPKGTKKRKAAVAKDKGGKKRFNISGKRGKRFVVSEPAKKDEIADEEILSDGSDIEGDSGESSSNEGDHEAAETADEKRLRLAKVYLEEIKRQERERRQDRKDDEEDELDIQKAVNTRLVKDDLEESGKLKHQVAHRYKIPSQRLVDAEKSKLYRDHKVHNDSISCLALSVDGSLVMAGSKDGGVSWWRLDGENLTLTKFARFAGGRKGHEEKHLGHCSAVNAVAISTDGAFFVSGDDSSLIQVWSVNDDRRGAPLSEAVTRVHTFKGHRSPVSGLSFRRNTHQLYSCSHDRSVKSWNLDEMCYVETLFGHQDRITGIDSGFRERAVTSGGRDGSVRIWKIVEESQLVFNAPSVVSNPRGAGSTVCGSVDAVKLLDEEHFVTSGEDGHLSLWGVMKKKPICTIKSAHGCDPTNEEPRWISSIGVLHNTDLVASGSHDGFVRLWKSDTRVRSLETMAEIDISHATGAKVEGEPAGGFVNAVVIHPNGKALVLGLGQEHRLGRWWRHKKARNGILVVGLWPSEANGECS